MLFMSFCIYADKNNAVSSWRPSRPSSCPIFALFNCWAGLNHTKGNDFGESGNLSVSILSQNTVIPSCYSYHRIYRSSTRSSIYFAYQTISYWWKCTLPLKTKITEEVIFMDCLKMWFTKIHDAYNYPLMCTAIYFLHLCNWKEAFCWVDCMFCMYPSDITNF